MPSKLSDLNGTYERLKLMILDGELASGEPLVERSLAMKLDVSRTPIRETIIRLQNEGLVRTIEGKGAFVASYTIEDLIEIYHVREGLEPIAVRLSCPHLPVERLLYFEKKLRAQAAEPNARYTNPGAWNRLGRDFHNLFIKGCQNERIIRIMEELQDQIELFRGLHRTISPNALSNSSMEEHLQILEALKARDAERAEHAARTHIQNGLRFRLEGLHRSSRGPAVAPSGVSSSRSVASGDRQAVQRKRASQLK
jgi:DNA-binding GntR family transcriptional regulator